MKEKVFLELLLTMPSNSGFYNLDPELNQTDSKIMFLVTARSIEKNYARISQRTLCFVTNKDSYTVRKSINKLRKLGYLKVIKKGKNKVYKAQQCDHNHPRFNAIFEYFQALLPEDKSKGSRARANIKLLSKDFLISSFVYSLRSYNTHTTYSYHTHSVRPLHSSLKNRAGFSNLNNSRKKSKNSKSLDSDKIKDFAGTKLDKSPDEKESCGPKVKRRTLSKEVLGKIEKKLQKSSAGKKSCGPKTNNPPCSVGFGKIQLQRRPIKSDSKSEKQPEGSGFRQGKKNTDHLNKPLRRRYRTSPAETKKPSTPKKKSRKEALKESFAKQKKKAPKPKKTIFDIKAEEYLDYWNTKGFQKHSKGTKRYKQLVHDLKKLRRGTLIPGFTEKVKMARFEELVDNFELAAFDPDFKPVNGFKARLAKASLQDFLYNTYLKGKIKSYLLEFALNPEPVIRTKVFDKEMLEELRTVWLASQGLDQDHKLPYFEEDKLIGAANNLAEFRNKYYKKLGLYSPDLNDQRIARWFIQAAFDTFEDTTKWDIGYLASQKMMSVFPRWLTKNSKWATGREGVKPKGHITPEIKRKWEPIYNCTDGRDFEILDDFDMVMRVHDHTEEEIKLVDMTEDEMETMFSELLGDEYRKYGDGNDWLDKKRNDVRKKKARMEFEEYLEREKWGDEW